ncbi:Gfo/Idh/MocA family oxidoreductase [Candidatus Poribacteria bacterium]|nr:Gfo/Idh/MocA family oxidoreductase [Candidatus Poribacteria bacterium]
MNRLRAAVLGLGLGRQRALGYLQNDAVVLCAVCDVDAARVSRFLEEHLEVHGYADYQTMLTVESPDIINVSTPDWMHLEHAQIALQHGCHVLLEKPMVRTLAEAEALIQAVEASGKTLMVGQNYRRIPMAVLAKQLLTEGRLGQIFYAAAETFQNKRRQFAQSPWYASAEYPRAALLGTGIHAVDLLRWLIGEVEEAFAYSNHRAYPEFPGDDFTMVLYRFTNGVVGRVGVAYGSVLPRGEGGLTLQLYGSEGSLNNDRFYVGESGQGEWQQGEVPPMKNSFWQEVDHFIECLKAGKSPAVDVYEGARNVAACLAGVEAANTGKAVKPVRF